MRLLPLLVRHERLRFGRSPLWAVRPLRVLSLIVLAYGAFLVVRQSLALPGLIADRRPGADPLAAVFGLVPLILVTDFWLRASLQETPLAPQRFYALLPVPRRLLTHLLLWRSLLSPYALLWIGLSAPFALTAGVPRAGWPATLVWWLALSLLLMANALCLTALRLLAARRRLWWGLPVALHLSALWLWEVAPATETLFTQWGEALLRLHPAALAPPLMLAAGMYALTFRLFMHRLPEADTEEGGAHRAAFVPELLRTEWLMRTRSARLRTALLAVFSCTALLCLTLCAAPATPSALFSSFTSFYCYAVPATVVLSGLPGHEAGWMDLLLLHRGGIGRLFRAKYLFCLTLLAAAFALQLPAVALGRTSLMESLCQLLLTSGVLCPMLFALAPFQRVALPLCDDAPDALPTTRMKALAALLLFVPLALERLCTNLWGEATAWAALAALGLAGTLLSPLWLRLTAAAFMKRFWIND